MRMMHEMFETDKPSKPQKKIDIMRQHSNNKTNKLQQICEEENAKIIVMQ